MKNGSTSRIVMGIDPGFDRVGWAIGLIEKNILKIITLGCIQTKQKQNKLARYLDLSSQLTSILKKHQPTEIAIETLFFSKNTATAMTVSEARGLILHCCLLINANIYEYHPNTIKQTVTGNGKADKTAVAKMVWLQLQQAQPQFEITKEIDDTIDALATLQTHAIIGHSIL